MKFKSPTGAPTFFRTYSRRKPEGRESFAEVVERAIGGLARTGKFTEKETQLAKQMMEEMKLFPSGRWMWVGGTPWIEKPENFSSAFNCTTTSIDALETFGFMMALGMMGCGTGGNLETKYISNLPAVQNRLEVRVVGKPGQHLVRLEETTVEVFEVSETEDFVEVEIVVGDSRQGWVSSMQSLLELAFCDMPQRTVLVTVDLSSVRPDGTPIKGFGGVANPVQLSKMYVRLVAVLNRYFGRQLDAEGVCLLLDEVAVTIVAGNVRRYAGMRQFDSTAELLKQNLWKQDSDGNWKIDPERDALRMSNHTRVYHYKPSLEECVDAIRTQYHSGEGAIQWAGEAVARANADLIKTKADKKLFIEMYDRNEEAAREVLIDRAYPNQLSPEELEHRMGRYELNPCLAAGTLVSTIEGHFPIESLVGKEVEIWDGNEWKKIDNFRVTGTEQPVYEVLLSSGQTITATAYHKFILEDGSRKMLSELEKGDRLLTHDAWTSIPDKIEPAAYLKGFLVGDGTSTTNGKVLLNLYEPKYCCEERLIQSATEIPKIDVSKLGFCEPCGARKFMSGLGFSAEELLPWVTTNRKSFPLEALNWHYDSKLEFIAGVMDADGNASDTKNGFLYQISSIHKEWLLGFQLLLRSIGVKSKLALNKKGGMKDFGERGGICKTQPLYRLTISQVSSVALSFEVNFSRLVSFAEKKVTYRLRNKEAIVESINFSHIADKVYCCTVEGTHAFALSNGVLIGQCGEIIGKNLHCNLVELHLNQIDPLNIEEQKKAFTVAGYSVASLLQRPFVEERYQYSRELDPIVGVSITGLFDFFVNAFGSAWLRWWESGRDEDWNNLHPQDLDRIENIATLLELDDNDDIWLNSDAALLQELEKRYLQLWKKVAYQSVWSYCDKHDLKRPNRCTTVQPAGTKSLLTGASSGWHPPKAQRYIRRITFTAYDPVAMACVDYGYTVVPSQSCKDEDGNLLDNPFDPRVNEWLVEIPVEVPWANLPGADQIDISRFPVKAQFGFWMQVQKYYAGHNVSSTLELRENEIEELGGLIHEAILKDEGYVSCAILARFDDKETFPRLPFEPISKDQYDQLQQQVLKRRESEDFQMLLERYDKGWNKDQGVTGCDSDKCLIAK